MRISIVNEDHIGVIKHIVSQGLAVVHIDEELFVIHEFIPADNVLHKTTLQGINITNMIKNHVVGAQITLQQQQAILTQIESLSAEKREYSHHYQWKTYQ